VTVAEAQTQLDSARDACLQAPTDEAIELVFRAEKEVERQRLLAEAAALAEERKRQQEAAALEAARIEELARLDTERWLVRRDLCTTFGQISLLASQLDHLATVVEDLVRREGELTAQMGYAPLGLELVRAALSVHLSREHTPELHTWLQARALEDFAARERYSPEWNAIEKGTRFLEELESNDD
jgi:hypothetical protein